MSILKTIGNGLLDGTLAVGSAMIENEERPKRAAAVQAIMDVGIDRTLAIDFIVKERKLNKDQQRRLEDDTRFMR